MEKLITAAETVAMAFGGAENFRAKDISDAVIIAAQQKFIRPVLGSGLCSSLAAADRESILQTWIKPALALYVKFLVLPSLAAQTGMAGVVQYVGDGYRCVEPMVFRRLLRRTRSDADTLLDSAVEYIESHMALFPEYEALCNVRKRVRMDGGVVF